MSLAYASRKVRSSRFGVCMLYEKEWSVSVETEVDALCVTIVLQSSRT